MAQLLRGAFVMLLCGENHLHPAGQRMLSWPNMLLSPVLSTCDISNVTSLLLRALCEAAQCPCWAEGRWAALKLYKSPLPNILFPSMNCHCGFQICPKLSPVTQLPDILLFPTFPVWVSGFFWMFDPTGRMVTTTPPLTMHSSALPSLFHHINNY